MLWRNRPHGPRRHDSLARDQIALALDSGQICLWDYKAHGRVKDVVREVVEAQVEEDVQEDDEQAVMETVEKVRSVERHADAADVFSSFGAPAVMLLFGRAQDDDA